MKSATNIFPTQQAAVARTTMAHEVSDDSPLFNAEQAVVRFSCDAPEKSVLPPAIALLDGPRPATEFSHDFHPTELAPVLGMPRFEQYMNLLELQITNFMYRWRKVAIMFTMIFFVFGMSILGLISLKIAAGAILELERERDLNMQLAAENTALRASTMVVAASSAVLTKDEADKKAYANCSEELGLLLVPQLPIVKQLSLCQAEIFDRLTKQAKRRLY